jgi:iron complex outermembrane receptor protein
MVSKKALLASCACAAAAMTASSAYAQAGAPATIEELVVTAERREQSLQDVPVAISAFTSEQRDLVGINTVQDITNFTPGLQYSSQLDRISLRGVGRLTNVQAADPGVATYSDGVYTSSTVEAGKTPIFVDRVEVLRGPQGTLYGRNSIGGAINVISKRPTDDFYAEVRGTYANYNHTTVEAAMSGPITEGLRFRIGANWDKQRDGYYHNLSGGPEEGGVVDTKYIEGQIEFDIGEHLDGWVKVSTAWWDNGSGGPGSRTPWRNGPYSTTEFGTLTPAGGFAFEGNSPGNTPIIPASRRAQNVVAVCGPPNFNDAREICTDTPERVKLDNTIVVAGELTWHGEGWDLKYITGGTNYHYTLTQDNDGTGVTSYVIPKGTTFISASATPCIGLGAACPALTVFPGLVSTYQEDKHWWSHEVNLASTGDGPFQWLGGAYYYHEAYKQPVYVTSAQPQVRTPTGATTPANPLGRTFDNRPQLADRSYAFFGQIDWEFAPTLKTTIGLRYSHDHKYGKESVRAICFGLSSCLLGATPEGLGSLTPSVDVTSALVFGLPTAANPNPVQPRGVVGPPTIDAMGFATRFYDASWDAVTGTAGIQWDPDDDTMMYARYSRGYKAGGFNVGITTTLGQFPYTGAEHANNYEVGFKKNFRTAQINAAIFYLDYKDLQAPLTVANTSGQLAPSQNQFVNVPKAESYGIEIESQWSPIEHLRFILNYSYLHARIKELTGIVDPDDPTALNQSATPLTPLVFCGPGTPGCDIATGAASRPQDLKGNHLPNAAPHKVAFNTLYTWEFEPGSLTASVSYLWRDTQYGTLFTRGYNKSPAWDQVDGRLTWKDGQNKYTVIAFIKNALNQKGYEGGASATRRSYTFTNPVVPLDVAGVARNLVGVQGLVTTYPLTPPRTYGVEVQYRF